MKRFAITTLVFSALAMGFSAQPVPAQVTVQVTIGRFYRELAPYGRWVNCRYGRCWVPSRVARQWQPYTNGRWVYTDYGWTWVSHDRWGSTPYHYGTWTFIRAYGWVWVPGTVWAPAWVTWTYSDRYVGWAPLPPSVVFGSSGYSGRPVVVSETQYVFVPTNRFVDTDVDSVRVSAQESATIFRQTTPVTSFAVSDGIVRNTAIPMETVQRARGGKIETRNISEARTAPGSMAEGSGAGRQVSVVAPASDVSAAVAAGPKAESRPAVSAKPEKREKAEVIHESRSARPESSQKSAAPHAVAQPERREPKAPKAQGAPPAERQQAAPAEPRQQQQQQPRAGAAKPAPAPPPAAQAAEPKQEQGHGKPAKKEKDKKEKDEKH